MSLLRLQNLSHVQGHAGNKVREGPILTLQLKLLQKFQEKERLLVWRLREERGVGERDN